jgi:hypothetical protein
MQKQIKDQSPGVLSSRSFKPAAFFVAVCCMIFSPGARGQITSPHWTQPTAEELAMTSQAGAPGAPAVYLEREEITDDVLHMRSFYFRLKVLTEEGKKYADVKVEYEQNLSTNDIYRTDFSQSVTDVAGRTIHPDGTIIPFTGKPYRVIEAKQERDAIAKMAFALPDVTVGSILEYRYKVRIPEVWTQFPRWFVQTDLYTRRAHFLWKTMHTVSWSSVLPSGAKLTQNIHEASPSQLGYGIYELNVADIPPAPDEQFMPPTHSFSYRVEFYPGVFNNVEEFWKDTGKIWQKEAEKFIGPVGSLGEQARTLYAPGDSDTVKLQKIYAAVMTMDNMSFSRERDKAENKAAGLKEIKTAQNVWDRKRGDSDDLTDTFVALARSAGFKAYVMRITNRDHNLFSRQWLNMEQLDEEVAIVVLDGKEQFFDPGQRYCPFGQMAWKHSETWGIREVEGGTTLASTPASPYLQSQLQRTGDLTLSADGTAQGTIKVSWTGSGALTWRQKSLTNDADEVKRLLLEMVKDHIPAGMEAELSKIDNLDQYEKPLTANFTVNGSLGAVTAKRIILPVEFFETKNVSPFPEPTRQVPVSFEYASRSVDAVRIKLPAGVTVESVPKEEHFDLPHQTLYHSRADQGAGTLLIQRLCDVAVPYFPVAQYPDLKDFYKKVVLADGQSIILQNAAVATGAKVSNGTGN